jgi:4-amino-4-deoxychorismate lyase
MNAPWTVAIAEERLDSADPWLRLKSSRRERYDAARATLPDGIDEILFLNERGEVCEGTITNVFLAGRPGMRTPAARCGLLPGVLRGEMLAGKRCREAVLRQEDLASGDLYVGNSLRGLIPARLAKA